MPGRAVFGNFQIDVGRGHRGAQIDVQVARLRQRRPPLRRQDLDVDRQRYLETAGCGFVQLQDNGGQDDVAVVHLVNVLLTGHLGQRSPHEHQPGQRAAYDPAAGGVPDGTPYGAPYAAPCSAHHGAHPHLSSSAPRFAQSVPGN